MKDIIREMTGIEPPPDAIPEPDWWLDRDEKRRDHVDELVVTDENQPKLDEVAVYLNRVLEREGNEARELYIPFRLNEIEQLDNHHVLSTLYDGAMVSHFIDMCAPDFLDIRVVHPPEIVGEEPYPLDDEKVEDNVQLALSSCKPLGIRLPSYNPKDWRDPHRHVPILLALLQSLVERYLGTYVNLTDTPELVRLALDEESSDEIADLRPSDWIPRWINRTLKRPLKSEVDPNKFNSDLFDVLAALEPEFSIGAPNRKFDASPQQNAQHMIDYVKNKMGVVTNIQPEDLISNNRKCQDLLAAQIFKMKSGLPKLSKREQGRFKSITAADLQGGADSLATWINSMLPGRLQIRNCQRDLQDGVVILKLLDKIKPGAINWQKVRDKEQIRHKFDKINNCNYAVKTAKGPFALKLVGAGGSDLHDSNQKFIHSLLWQLMRYQSVQALSALSFGGKKIEDKDILAWANELILKLPEEERKSVPLRSFKDRQLTTCVFYLELLKIIMPKAIQDDIVYYDLEPLQELSVVLYCFP